MASSRLEKLLNAGQFFLSAELRPLRHYNENSFMAELDFLDKIPCLSIANELFEHLDGRYSRVGSEKTSRFERLDSSQTRTFLVITCALSALETVYLGLSSQQDCDKS